MQLGVEFPQDEIGSDPDGIVAFVRSVAAVAEVAAA